MVGCARLSDVGCFLQGAEWVYVHCGLDWLNNVRCHALRSLTFVYLFTSFIMHTHLLLGSVCLGRIAETDVFVFVVDKGRSRGHAEKRGHCAPRQSLPLLV